MPRAFAAVGNRRADRDGIAIYRSRDAEFGGVRLRGSKLSHLRHIPPAAAQLDEDRRALIPVRAEIAAGEQAGDFATWAPGCRQIKVMTMATITRQSLTCNQCGKQKKPDLFGRA